MKARQTRSLRGGGIPNDKTSGSVGIPNDKTSGSSGIPNDKTSDSGGIPNGKTSGSAGIPNGKTSGSDDIPNDKTSGSAGIPNDNLQTFPRSLVHQTHYLSGCFRIRLCSISSKEPNVINMPKPGKSRNFPKTYLHLHLVILSSCPSMKYPKIYRRKKFAEAKLLCV
jgi:hypothetical protein